MQLERKGKEKLYLFIGHARVTNLFCFENKGFMKKALLMKFLIRRYYSITLTAVPKAYEYIIFFYFNFYILITSQF